MAGTGKKRAAFMVAGNPLSTRERIVATSIRLFNREGVKNIAVERIAKDMGISPGTLTYHFALKQDLMRHLLCVIDSRIRESLLPPTGLREPQTGGEYLKRILLTFWDFRFFFNALTHLLQQDDLLRKHYTDLQNWAISTIDDDMHELIRKGDLKPTRPPNTSRLLAENIWSQWLNWLRMQQIASPTAPVPAGKALYDGALHHWSLLEPYLLEDVAKGLLPVYRKLFTGITARSRARRWRRNPDEKEHR